MRVYGEARGWRIAFFEGAGVRLQRAFGFGKTKDFDPFLLLDDFRNDNPADYLAGFPWHPHRGIETTTYVLAGSVDHGDSLGNRGSMTAGDVQWMTAGRGILHQEMPKGDAQGLRHSKVQTTLDLYSQSVSEDRRAPQSQILAAIFGEQVGRPQAESGGAVCMPAVNW